MRRVVTVGRRYYNSEGRLLLTNDGGLARSLELPSRGWVRRYRVRVHGQVDPERLAKLAAGVTVGENRYGPIAATLDRSEEHTSELQSLMRTSYAVFCLKKKNTDTNQHPPNTHTLKTTT